METIGRYRILAEVAQGGMGTVYRAVGPAQEQVAIKLLSSGEQATSQQRRRFETEVQALLRVRHPHVVAILDAGLARGVPWLAMDWVEGETLEERLEQGGPLPVDRAVELTLALADALTHCHAQGVLHRDLKPANVLLRAADDVPLLTDFGLARDVTAGSASRLTKEGGLLGTPGWWPPEQAKGELAQLGPRSDVYGLAALLFGMLTGRPPQEGSQLQELLRALDQPPPRPSKFARGVPRWLDEAVERGLALDPQDRPPSADAFAGELRGVVGLRGIASGRRLRFVAASGIVLVMAGLGAWRVCSTARQHVAEVAADLPSDGPDDGLPLPEIVSPPSKAEATLALGTQRLETGDLEGALSAAEEVLRQDAASAPAYYLRGQVRLLSSELAAALSDFDQALTHDPRHAHALVNRGLLLERRGRVDEALRDYDRAIELAPALAMARNNRGWLRDQRGDRAGALEDYEKALELDPRLGRAWVNRGWLRDRRGDLAGARADYDRAIELVPDHAGTYCNRGWLRHRQGDLKGALADYEQSIALQQRNPIAHSNRADIHARQGRELEARADHDRAVGMGEGVALVWNNRGWFRAQRGDPAGALADYAKALAIDPRFALALVNRAALLLQRKLYLEARNDLDRVLSVEPGHAVALHLRGIAREQLGDVAGATADQTRALERMPRARWAARARSALARLKSR